MAHKLRQVKILTWKEEHEDSCIGTRSPLCIQCLVLAWLPSEQARDSKHEEDVSRKRGERKKAVLLVYYRDNGHKGSIVDPEISRRGTVVYDLDIRLLSGAQGGKMKYTHIP
ncbi:hypothetical protein MRX96_047968 [Rhipicephalus microplus]